MKFLWMLSRPRFWHYIVGPWFLGVLAGLNVGGSLPSLWIIWLFWWLIPANLLVYAINDLFDYPTDIQNPKKRAQEAFLPLSKHRLVAHLCIALVCLGLIFCFLAPTGSLFVILFLILGIGYSMPPLRFKERPFIDMLSNALYMVPGLHGFSMTGAIITDGGIVIAAILWCMAMHAFSAVPDIVYDSRAHMQTTATLLGQRGTLLLCAGLFFVAGLLPFSSLLAILGSGYAGICLFLFFYPQYISKVYWWFPWINLLAGACITMVYYSSTLFSLAYV